MNAADYPIAEDCRSVLYMPASNARVLAKGVSLPADAIILDLEDSVAGDSKALARQQAVAALSSQDYGYRVRVLRINAGDTPWYIDDVAAVLAASPDAVLLPKVESEQDIVALSAALDEVDDTARIAIWAMMESPMAVINAARIAATSITCPRLKALLIGNNDMARAAGMPVMSDRTYLIPWLMTIVAAGRAHGLAVFDGVYNNFADTSGFSTECEQGVAMGMTGKTLIHPSQISIANKVFSPSALDITHAQSVVDAFSQPENSASGVLQINGRMIERLHLSMARQLLARVDRLSQRR